MKISLKTILVLALTVWVSQAAEITWSGTLLSGDDSVTHDGKLLQNNWYIALYQSTDGTLDINTSDLSVNMLFNTILSTVGDPAPPPAQNVSISSKSNIGLTDNINIFTVIFDNADYNAASSYAVFDTTVWNVGSDVNPVAYQPNINAGIVSINGSWQAVPEPATMMLIAAGGGVVFLARIRKRFKA